MSSAADCRLGTWNGLVTIRAAQINSASLTVAVVLGNRPVPHLDTRRSSHPWCCWRDLALRISTNQLNYRVMCQYTYFRKSEVVTLLILHYTDTGFGSLAWRTNVITEMKPEVTQLNLRRVSYFVVLSFDVKIDSLKFVGIYFWRKRNWKLSRVWTWKKSAASVKESVNIKIQSYVTLYFFCQSNATICLCRNCWTCH